MLDKQADTIWAIPTCQRLFQIYKTGQTLVYLVLKCKGRLSSRDSVNWPVGCTGVTNLADYIIVNCSQRFTCTFQCVRHSLLERESLFNAQSVSSTNKWILPHWLVCSRIWLSEVLGASRLPLPDLVCKGATTPQRNAPVMSHPGASLDFVV